MNIQRITGVFLFVLSTQLVMAGPPKDWTFEPGHEVPKDLTVQYSMPEENGCWSEYDLKGYYKSRHKDYGTEKYHSTQLKIYKVDDQHFAEIYHRSVETKHCEDLKPMECIRKEGGYSAYGSQIFEREEAAGLWFNYHNLSLVSDGVVKVEVRQPVFTPSLDETNGVKQEQVLELVMQSCD